ncbi:Retrovirus-related Pol polyprotein from transposon TNT 1-94 [Eumeta japonica]|uniref:Retrovirus-related Pol polyprotein from transposon TNT 1-94 n=1 Tax=Eumeta variegata TaxID=151549 RepID=A0A4C1XRB7_EUMVA|nr:Retrovirus-related Pol polyprotein from transposon TNT 1-94 [Eumeta japonica]
MGSNNNMTLIERLTGRDNFASWKFAVKTYLEHEDLWECVSGTGEDASSAKEVWEKLCKAFDDSGLTRRVGLLRDLITTTLENCQSIEEYVNKIMTTAHKLRNIGFKVDDEWLGTLLLAGLPDEYKPMIMAIESSGVAITADSIKTKLLQEVKNRDPRLIYDETPPPIKTIRVANDKELRVESCGKVNIHVKSKNGSTNSIQRLGHLNYNDMKKLKDHTDGVTMPQNSELTCVPCIKGKQARSPFPCEGSRANQLLEIIHSDICGPMEKSLWAEAIRTAAYITNRTPTRALNYKTPEETYEDALSSEDSELWIKSIKEELKAHEDNGTWELVKKPDNVRLLDWLDVENSMACKLIKSLYGLKQAPRCWNAKFNSVLNKYGFFNSHADKCVYGSLHVGDVRHWNSLMEQCIPTVFGIVEIVFICTLGVINFQSLIMELKIRHWDSITKQRILVIFALAGIVLKNTLATIDFPGLMTERFMDRFKLFKTITLYGHNTVPSKPLCHSKRARRTPIATVPYASGREV